MNDEQLLRYSRQIMLEGFDIEGQQKLLAAKVLIVGLGGLGCPVAMYLAAAGVGELWLADYDAVDLSNLQRQIAHSVDDLGHPKAFSASETLRALNPEVRTLCLSDKLEGQILEDAVARVDLVIDASDNFSTRFAVNRACVQHKKPLVSGAAIRTEGQLICFDAREVDSPCYRCLYSDDSDDENLSCSESGVLSPVVGVIGSLQAVEALKIIAGFGEVAVGKLLMFDAGVMEWRSLRVKKDPGCPVCSVRTSTG